MEQKKLRLVLAGSVLLGLAAAFFLGMTLVAACSSLSAPSGLSLALCPLVTWKTNDPVAMMQAVGQVSGAAAGLSVVMIVIGVIRKIRDRNSREPPASGLR